MGMDSSHNEHNTSSRLPENKSNNFDASGSSPTSVNANGPTLPAQPLATGNNTPVLPALMEEVTEKIEKSAVVSPTAPADPRPVVIPPPPPAYQQPPQAVQPTYQPYPQGAQPYTSPHQQSGQPPSSPYAQPGQPYASPYPAQPKPAPKQPGKLAQPLPLWVLLVSIVLVVALMVVLHLTGSDWAAGAAHASTAALIIGLTLIAVLVVRTINGMASSLNSRRLWQYIFSIISIAVLLIYSGISQALVPTLHLAQASSLEQQQQWQAAINEYTSGGERAPQSVSLARTYASWGLALNDKQNYNDAVNKFNAVIQQFNGSNNSAQVARAQQGMIAARFALGQQSMQAKQYADATSRFDTILALSYCDSSCHAKVSSPDATAYYELGEGHLQSKDYTNAVTAFDNVLTNFSSAPEAKQLHGDMAKSLLGQGQSMRSTSCSSAIPTYQRLAKEFKDTPEGKKAQSDLNVSQTVSGTFSNIEKDATYSQIALVHGLTGGMNTDALQSAWDNATLKTDIQSNGRFVFNNIAQGSYDLLWYGNDGTYAYYEFIYHQATKQPKYVASVGPLCSVDMGSVSNAKGLSL
jgi:tetratricopeptide (TPR) repeat protein